MLPPWARYAARRKVRCTQRYVQRKLSIHAILSTAASSSNTETLHFFSVLKFAFQALDAMFQLYIPAHAKADFDALDHQRQQPPVPWLQDSPPVLLCEGSRERKLSRARKHRCHEATRGAKTIRSSQLLSLCRHVVQNHIPVVPDLADESLKG